MKITSYEISKKLKEAGFEAETDFYWYCYDKWQEMRHIADADGKGNVKAYDLETLLYALPKINKQEYLLCSGGIVYLNDDYISVGKEKNESLADTAARLLIKLYNAGFVKFKEE